MSAQKKKSGIPLRLQLLVWFMIIALIPILSLSITSNAQMQATQGFIAETELEHLGEISEANADFIGAWLDSRMNDMSYIASLEETAALDFDSMSMYLEALAEEQPIYDTIYVVGTDGLGIAGVTYENGNTTVLSETAANEFDVADRDWFQQASSGEPSYSEPLVSRATGNFVITVATPVVDESGEIVAVVRGAVLLGTIFERVASLNTEVIEAYFLDMEGSLIDELAEETPPLETEVAQRVQANESGTTVYQNENGTTVLAGFVYIPRLDWGLVLEVPEDVALGEANDLQSFYSILFWGIVVGSIILIIVLATFVARSFTKPIGLASSAVARVAAGDLRFESDNGKEESNNEVKMLQFSVRQMSNALSSLIADVFEKSQTVASTSQELTASTVEVTTQADDVTASVQIVHERAEEQAEQVKASNDATLKVVAGMQKAGKSMEEMKREVSDSKQRTEQSAELMSQAVERMEGLREQTNKSATSIKSLDNHMKEISDIVTFITDIAEQTNLLSLNASIEAARAGEHGKSFAVVANEVNKLADRTSKASKQISSLIRKTQEQTMESVEMIESSNHLATDTATIVHDVGDVIRTVTQDMTVVQERMSVVQHSIRDMESNVEVVKASNASMVALSDDTATQAQSVAHASENQAATMQEVAAAAQELSKMAEELQEKVEHFRY
ncbi:methyl-accepting chemotaxis protein [Paenalkalicoccus suaedae]|uniref:Methyl-accepting chemotaxis protein n=1 Tax=Paenalkalicoccus suaedae TaxID=2592382 RepID=A0A859FHZ4_9BACI|nr:methyl-accepting chemotaxis protein [Paenalkalicoccus suaedae]QKS72699.1 methyl-accepting chemotaxis protein [Paenalkalicoccus suaedae]